MKTIDLIECQEILEERKRRGFNMVDMETAESLLWHYQTESQLCLDNAKVASEALKENAKLKEALRPLAEYNIAEMTTADVWIWLGEISKQAKEALNEND